MIRFNLFPFRAARIKENIRRQVTIYFLSIIFLILASTYFHIDLNNKLSALKKEQYSKQKELDSFKDTNVKIATLKKAIAEVEVKLNTIKLLEKGKTGPVKLLDDIAMSVPEDKLWLTAFKERNGRLTLDGTAMDNETVADFMDRLKNTQSISSVELVRTRHKEIQNFDLNLKDFSLSSKTYAFKEKTPPTADKKK